LAWSAWSKPSQRLLGLIFGLAWFSGLAWFYGCKSTAVNRQKMREIDNFEYESEN
jgi:hypothetical protein